MDEYQRMFALTETDRQKRILGCGDGPASFNAELTQLGGRVTSIDPIYALSPEEITRQFQDGIEPIMSFVRANPRNYVWSYHRDPDDLLRCRRQVMESFLADYAAGLAQKRYLVAELPKLPFADNAFELAVCSHLLFLYSDMLSYEFHRESILDLCRVAGEVRVFPITDLNCEISPRLQPLVPDLQSTGLRVEIVTVDYQLQRNGNRMMRISSD